MNWRRIRKWLLLLLLFGVIALIAVAWFVGGKLIEPANRVVGPPPDDYPASSVTIDSDSGATLAAWHLKVPDSTSTAILLHPHRMDRRAMLSRAMPNLRPFNTEPPGLLYHVDNAWKTWMTWAQRYCKDSEEVQIR